MTQKFAKNWILSYLVFTGEVTIVLPSNWMPPEGADAERLNFTGTISSINFDQVPIRIVVLQIGMKLHELLFIVGPNCWVFEHWTTTNLRIYPDKRNPNDLKPIVRKPYAIKATPCGFQGSYLRLAKAFIEDPSQEPVQLKE